VKIVQVNKIYGHEGGVEQYLHACTLELSRRGHEVAFICGERAAGAEEFVAPERLTVIPELLVPESLSSALSALGSALERFRPDVVYLHHLVNPAFVAPLAAHAPVVRFAHMEDVVCPMREKSFLPAYEPCTYRAGPATCGVLCPFVHRYGSRHPARIAERLSLQAAQRRANSRVSRWVVASEFMRASLVREGVPASRVSLNPYFTRLPPEPAPPVDDGELLFVGRLVPSKGVNFLLRALRELPSRVRLAIAGEGPERPALEAQAVALGLGSRVRFLGRVANDRLGEPLARAAILVVPSVFQEPFGIVGIEAMAHARPVVAHRVGGVAQWCEDGVTGSLVDAKDVPALARRILELVESPARARAMGAAGRARVSARFLAERHMSTLLEELADVVG
jgi:glycosyltransferase involved in cell wall biosynthesis